MNRRDFVAAIAAGAGLAGCVGPRRTGPASGWNRVPEILARIQAPRFPDLDFPVTRFGAVGNGSTDCTGAFRQAIAACNAAGGGRVMVPEGRFLTGPIQLQSNVNLHVAAGGTIAFSRDPRAYLPAVFTRWEGVEMMGYAPLIRAWEQRNVAVTGEGTLDGQASSSHWWPWKGQPQHGWKAGEPHQKAARDRLFAQAEQGVPVQQRVFAEGSFLRPQFIQPYRCTNVLIEGVRIINSPMWEIHPVLCQNVTVRGVRIETHGPNNDGCDPESCRDVLIEGCFFDTGDDCIALKSGRNADGRRLATPIENVVIRGCQMKDGHGGVTVGSEISGGARWIFAEDCQMDSPNLERALRIKTNAMRGGVIEHVYMRDCTIGQVEESVLSVDFHYEEGARGPYPPTVRTIELRNVTSGRSEYALFLRGFPANPIQDVALIGCSFRNVERGNVLEHVEALRAVRASINDQPWNPPAS